MPIFDIDLSAVSSGGVPDGTHTGTIQKVEYQIKTGEKWNQEGTTNVSRDEFNITNDLSKARMHITIGVPGLGNIWHDLYFSEKALGFVKSFYKALGCNLTDEIEGKSIGISVVTKEEPGYDSRPSISKVFKA